MKEILLVIGFLAGWFILQAYVLPKFGFKTWLIPQNRQAAVEQVKDNTAGQK